MAKSIVSSESLTGQLKERANFLRRRGLAINSRTLHAGAALSSADVVAVLFYHTLRLDPGNPDWADRDYYVHSRGHGCEPVYAAMADLGFFGIDELDHVEEWGSNLHGLAATTTPGIEFSCGSLGQGLSLGVGTALGLRALKRPGRVFVLTGDGECQEGSVWEAAMAAGHYKLERLTLIVDRNRYSSGQRGTEAVMALEPLDERFRAFGFGVRRVDGHDLEALVTTFDSVPFIPGAPSVIIADTVKGKGVSFCETDHMHCGRFGRDFDSHLLAQALKELEET